MTKEEIVGMSSDEINARIDEAIQRGHMKSMEQLTLRDRSYGREYGKLKVLKGGRYYA